MDGVLPLIPRIPPLTPSWAYRVTFIQFCKIDLTGGSTWDYYTLDENTSRDSFISPEMLPTFHNVIGGWGVGWGALLLPDLPPPEHHSFLPATFILPLGTIRPIPNGAGGCYSLFESPSSPPWHRIESVAASGTY